MNYDYFFNDFLFANFSHDDPNPAVKNPDNECYCLKDEGFRCFKSGVTYMEPCKRELVNAQWARKLKKSPSQKTRQILNESISRNLFWIFLKVKF